MKAASKEIILVDAGTGNLRSVYHALVQTGCQITVTDKPQEIEKAGKAVLPGVGAFGAFMQGLKERKILEPILELIEKQVPLLGICVGMQALFDFSEELGIYDGLGVIKGKVAAFPDSIDAIIPHTGWNQLWLKKESPLLNGIQEGEYVYFNHTFYCQPQDTSVMLTETDHDLRYASAVQKDNLFGVQFHPEKSQTAGLKILENFTNL